MTVTIFTPTYNRAYSLGRLYESLLSQSCGDFEWLVVDDGSKDNTEQLINSFISEEKISIRYIKTPNGGKHRAMNLGAHEALGELFFIVDSDDYITDNAVERLLYHYKTVKDNCLFSAVSGRKSYPNGEKIGGEVGFDIIESSGIDRYYKYKVKGDMAEAWKTSVLREYPFPDFEGEKFCSEAAVFLRMDMDGYKIKYFNETICFCEYLSDGLTFNKVRLFSGSPRYTMLVYALKVKTDIPFIDKAKAYINYWRYTIGYRGSRKGELSLPWRGYVFYLAGLVIFVMDKLVKKR